MTNKIAMIETQLAQIIEKLSRHEEEIFDTSWKSSINSEFVKVANRMEAMSKDTTLNAENVQLSRAVSSIILNDPWISKVVSDLKTLQNSTRRVEDRQAEDAVSILQVKELQRSVATLATKPKYASFTSPAAAFESLVQMTDEMKDFMKDIVSKFEEMKSSDAASIGSDRSSKLVKTTGGARKVADLSSQIEALVKDTEMAWRRSRITNMTVGLRIIKEISQNRRRRILLRGWKRWQARDLLIVESKAKQRHACKQLGAIKDHIRLRAGFHRLRDIARALTHGTLRRRQVVVLLSMSRRRGKWDKKIYWNRWRKHVVLERARHRSVISKLSVIEAGDPSDSESDNGSGSDVHDGGAAAPGPLIKRQLSQTLETDAHAYLDDMRSMMERGDLEGCLDILASFSRGLASQIKEAADWTHANEQEFAELKHFVHNNAAYSESKLESRCDKIELDLNAVEQLADVKLNELTEELAEFREAVDNQSADTDIALGQLSDRLKKFERSRVPDDEVTQRLHSYDRRLDEMTQTVLKIDSSRTGISSELLTCARAAAEALEGISETRRRSEDGLAYLEGQVADLKRKDDSLSKTLREVVSNLSTETEQNSQWHLQLDGRVEAIESLLAAAAPPPPSPSDLVDLFRSIEDEVLRASTDSSGVLAKALSGETGRKVSILAHRLSCFLAVQADLDTLTQIIAKGPSGIDISGVDLAVAGSGAATTVGACVVSMQDYLARREVLLRTFHQQFVELLERSCPKAGKARLDTRLVVHRRFIATLDAALARHSYNVSPAPASLTGKVKQEMAAILAQRFETAMRSISPPTFEVTVQRSQRLGHTVISSSPNKDQGSSYYDASVKYDLNAESSNTAVAAAGSSTRPTSAAAIVAGSGLKAASRKGPSYVKRGGFPMPITTAADELVNDLSRRLHNETRPEGDSLALIKGTSSNRPSTAGLLKPGRRSQHITAVPEREPDIYHMRKLTGQGQMMSAFRSSVIHGGDFSHGAVNNGVGGGGERVGVSQMKHSSSCAVDRMASFDDDIVDVACARSLQLGMDSV